MEYKETGVVIELKDTEEVSDSFKKREFVIEVPNERSPEYPEHFAFQCTQDRVDMLNDVSVGDKLAVSFNIRSKEWNGRWFTNLDAWRIEKESTETRRRPGEH